jgi:S1-C subfamily serine protease
LREGDIITTIAGQPVQAAGDVEQVLARAPEHARVPLQVIRQWQPMEVVVEL